MWTCPKANEDRCCRPRTFPCFTSANKGFRRVEKTGASTVWKSVGRGILTWALRIGILIGAFISIGNLGVSLSQDVQREDVREAFLMTHDGWSVDEVLLDDRRRERFLDAVRRRDPKIDEKTICDELLRLRKSGKLDAKTTQREGRSLEEVLSIAEIAARSVQDRLGGHVDHLLTDSNWRRAFDDTVGSMGVEGDPYRFRKAALGLRKSRSLAPELTLRVVDWKREIATWDLDKAKEKVDTFPRTPAVYIFRDRTGYLYIGQTNNLKERMSKHLLDSDRRSLAKYLEDHFDKDIQIEIHSFGKDSPARETRVREAYESELIRTRKPRLNIAP